MGEGKNGDKSPPGPLRSFGLLCGIAEAAVVLVLPRLEGAIQEAFVWFAVGFPILITVLFFGTLWTRPQVYYGPGDYADESNFRELMASLKSTRDNVYASAEMVKGLALEIARLTVPIATGELGTVMAHERTQVLGREERRQGFRSSLVRVLEECGAPKSEIDDLASRLVRRSVSYFPSVCAKWVYRTAKDAVDRAAEAIATERQQWQEMESPSREERNARAKADEEKVSALTERLAPYKGSGTGVILASCGYDADAMSVRMEKDGVLGERTRSVLDQLTAFLDRHPEIREELLSPSPPTPAKTSMHFGVSSS